MHRAPFARSEPGALEIGTPYLMVLTGGSVGRIYRLNVPRITVGRCGHCEILLEEDGVSRTHAEIACRPDGEVLIRDLGSTNGTWIEGRRVDVQSLSEGDHVQFGSRTIFRFGHHESIEERLDQQSYESATRDSLTGAYNKRFLLEHLGTEFAWHQRHQEPMTLILVDVDSLHRVNEVNGHEAGDAVLKHLAGVCRTACRAEDVFARFGGEEFAYLLRHTPAAGGAVLAERIRARLAEEPVTWSAEHGSAGIPLTVSAGVAELDPQMAEPRALIEAAAHRLSHAKCTGRNRVESARPA